jgi:hypothetical protein
MKKNRYALLTVDTEALPKRASGNHVKRLMWGECEKGTAGIREMCSLGDDVGAKHVFFVDICGAYIYRSEVDQVIAWLDGAGQDVQMHLHPNYLPKTFWKEHGLSSIPMYMSAYDDARAEFIITHFSQKLSSITGKKTRAFRAGSFRWNAGIIRALAKAEIALSFNNTMRAMRLGQCIYSLPTNLPFAWPNGVIEVPVTERHILPPLGRDWWCSLQYPEYSMWGYSMLRYRPWWCSFLPFSVDKTAPLLVYLLHSWSLLYWDEKGHGVYVDDRRIEGYRKLLKRLAKDYDIITTAELLDLFASGKMAVTHTEDLSKAELPKGKS